LPAENAKVQLVHHGAGFERMIPTLPLQETRGDLAQLRVTAANNASRACSSPSRHLLSKPVISAGCGSSAMNVRPA
jgi:hypothetical protein